MANGYNHPTVVAVREYQEAHPELDFSKVSVELRPNGDGTYTAVGHREMLPGELWDLDRCCCHPDKPRHHD